MSIPAGHEPRWTPADGEYLEGPIGEVPPDWRQPAGLDRMDDEWARFGVALYPPVNITPAAEFRIGQQQAADEIAAAAVALRHVELAGYDEESAVWNGAMFRLRDAIDRRVA